MDIKSLFVGQLAGGDSATHPNYASRPAVTYDVATQQLVYSQNGTIAKVKAPIGRSVSTTGNIIASDENTIILTDTTAGVIVLTLPSAVAGDTYHLLDSKAKWGVNKITLATNTYFGTASSTYDLKLQGSMATIKYINSTIGWVVIISSSPINAVPSTINPTALGTAAPGVSSAYSREDHVHPTDSTKASLVSPAFTGTPTVNGIPIPAAVPQINTYIVGSATPYTWTLPTNAKLVDVFVCGPGGGGASGSKGTAATVALSGGAGGAGGAMNHFQFIASSLSATSSITVGIGGAGGAAVSAASTNGNSGGNGSGTTFTSGSISVRSSSVGGGVAGAWSGTLGVSGTGNSSVSSSGYACPVYSFGGSSFIASGTGAQAGPSLTLNRSSDSVSGIVGPGLAGGSIAVGGTALTPAVSQGQHNVSANLTSNTTTPGSIALSGSNGVGALMGNLYYAFGGSGGAASITAATAAQAGGNGIYGSGGAGGGAALDSAGNSGAGGNGGDGWCVIVTTF